MDNYKRNLFRIGLLILILPLLAGCISIKKGQEAGFLGGFFMSEDSGENWAYRVAVYTSNAEEKDFSSANITTMAFDPQDESAIYLGTQNSGIFYTYNYGQGWHNTLPYNGSVNDIIVDPEDKCLIYAAIHNKFWKSEDCMRTWRSPYFESREGQYLTALNMSYQEPNIIYAGTNGGSFLRSLDRGESWEVLKRFNNQIMRIIVQNHSDSNIIYAVTKSKGVFRSTDKGVNWQDLMELPVVSAEESGGAKKFSDVKLEDEAKPFFKISNVKIAVAADSDRSLPDGLIYTNRIGMFRFVGDFWEQLKLLTPNKKDTIYSVAINPLNTNDIFYGTDNALYHSLDGGVNWSVKKLPTKRAAGVLKFSPNHKYLYLGAYKIEQ